MRYLLDTNAVIGLLKGHPKLTGRVRRFLPEDFGVPAVAAHKLYFGAYKGQQTVRSLATVDALQLEVLAFDNEDARRAGEIRASLAKSGRQIGAYDVLIAGQATARGLTLITHNTREFSRVAGLQIADWEIG